MAAGALGEDAEQVAPGEHLHPGAQRPLGGPPAAAVDRHLSRAGEEPPLRPALHALAGEVVRLGHERDPAVQRQRHEHPVGEREVVGGQDRPALGRYVLRALDDRVEDLLHRRTEQHVAHHPVEAAALAAVVVLGLGGPPRAPRRSRTVGPATWPPPRPLLGRLRRLTGRLLGVARRIAHAVTSSTVAVVSDEGRPLRTATLRGQQPGRTIRPRPLRDGRHRSTEAGPAQHDSRPELPAVGQRGLDRRPVRVHVLLARLVLHGRHDLVGDVPQHRAVGRDGGVAVEVDRLADGDLRASVVRDAEAARSAGPGCRGCRSG